MAVAEAVGRDLLKLPAELQDCALAASALALAELLDNDATARDAAALGRELRATMTELRAQAARAPAEEDPVDDLAARRAARLAAAPPPQRSAGGQ